MIVATVVMFNILKLIMKIVSYYLTNLSVNIILNFKRNRYVYDVSTMSLIVKHADEERRPCEITYAGT
jgi:hypothetical protein